jgi:hypothetical protein
MDNDTDKTYMFLAIITFVALAVAFGFIYAGWSELTQTSVSTAPLFQ